MTITRFDQLDSTGYCLLRGLYSREECTRYAAELQEQLSASDSPVVQKRGDVIYGARDLLRIYPEATKLWQRDILLKLLMTKLGKAFGLVRGLFFDKPQGAGWSLPWHRDLTIAVRDNKLPSDAFKHPTCKAGLPHVEAPRELLERMLTLRIHLDDVTDVNGPLRVAPGSHLIQNDAEATTTHEVIYASAGDVLVMRPLLMHSSTGVEELDADSDNDQAISTEQPERHRRVIHLEFAADAKLPDGYAWRDFFRAKAG